MSDEQNSKNDDEVLDKLLEPEPIVEQETAPISEEKDMSEPEELDTVNSDNVMQDTHEHENNDTALEQARDDSEQDKNLENHDNTLKNDEGVNTANKDYFEDDELFNDSVVVEAQEDVLGVFKQDDGVVSVEIVNFFKENGNPRSKLALNNDPPIVVMRDSAGQTAQFVLTKHMASHCKNMFTDAHNAYYGIKPKEKTGWSQEDIKGRFESTKVWISDNKIKFAMILVLIVFVAVGLII